LIKCLGSDTEHTGSKALISFTSGQSFFNKESSGFSNCWQSQGKDKRERRNQKLSRGEKLTYSGKNYVISTVDLSKNGDLVKFTKEKNLIEINEQHPLYIKASKNSSLDSLVRVLAFTEIAMDYSEGNFIVFDNVFNTLARLVSEKY